MTTEGDTTAHRRELLSEETLRLVRPPNMEVSPAPPEDRLERICRLAQHAMGVQVAAVSLVTGDNVRFRSVAGWRIRELPIKHSLCREVLETGEPRVVPDMMKDPEYSTSRLVIKAPKFRFYAGYPIKNPEGNIIGTFCVFDQKPKRAADALMTILTDLGGMAEHELATVDLWDAQNELVEKLGEARHQAMLDTLTQVWNRRGGMELLEMMLEHGRETHEQFAVCMADVDFFKAINDTHGHTVGDRVLRDIASALVSSVRPNDMVVRYGGDEFMLVLRDCSEATARKVALRIRNELQRKQFSALDEVAAVTLSLGITVNEHLATDTVEDIINRADQALYHTKKSGRDGVSLWCNDLQ